MINTLVIECAVLCVNENCFACASRKFKIMMSNRGSVAHNDEEESKTILEIGLSKQPADGLSGIVTHYPHYPQPIPTHRHHWMDIPQPEIVPPPYNLSFSNNIHEHKIVRVPNMVWKDRSVHNEKGNNVTVKFAINLVIFCNM